MLIPQYSLRLLLLVTTAAGGVFSIFALAARGHGWAQGVSVGIVALAVAMLVYAFMFLLLWLFTVATGRFRRRRVGPGRSPFAAGSRAADPQVIPASPQEKAATPIILD